MKVYTSPMQPNGPLTTRNVTVFLGGGITGCPQWQNQVLQELDRIDISGEHNLTDLVMLNPRRTVYNPDDTVEQIKWEFQWLNNVDIFTMNFCSGDQVQPICMYELGRYYAIMSNKYELSWPARVIVNVNRDYCRYGDVLNQMSLAEQLACGNIIPLDIPWFFENLEPAEYAKEIIRHYEYIRSAKIIANEDRKFDYDC